MDQKLSTVSTGPGAEPPGLDRYWPPFTATRAFRARPRLIVGAEGLHYVTADGRRVLDSASGLYCVNAGHGRKRIARAIQGAADRLDYAPAFQFAHPDALALADRLVAMAPANIGAALLGCSGSEAVETALKVALSYHRLRGEGQRTRLIGRERGYHGVCFGGVSVGGIVNNRAAFGPLLPGVDHLPSTYERREQAFSTGEPTWGAHLADELERVIGLHGAANVAAVIVEPVAGSTGCLPPPRGYLERLRAITKRHGVLLIFDETITAFGRLGHAFAATRYGVEPDIITFAKAVTNGAAPLSGALVSRDIHDTHMQGPEHVIEFFHGHTYSGHPLGVAAALATLDLHRDDGLYAEAARKETAFAEIMMSLREAPHVLDIRPIGLMCGLDLAPLADAPGQRGFDVMERAFHENDLYARVGGDTVVVAPPLTASVDELTEIRDRLFRTLTAIA